jgi:hypothetical protein
MIRGAGLGEQRKTAAGEAAVVPEIEVMRKNASG